jgi:transposase-like protein
MTDSQRVVPYHCPFCGGENLRPHEPPDDAPATAHAGWECRECTRVFSVKLIGLVVNR